MEQNLSREANSVSAGREIYGWEDNVKSKSANFILTLQGRHFRSSELLLLHSRIINVGESMPKCFFTT
jgi:hypothetical protein